VSVINQMLVDLEERRAADRPAIQARQTAYVAAGVSHRKQRIPRALAWSVAVLILGAAAYAVHRSGDSSELFSLLGRTVSSAVAGTREEPATPVANFSGSSPDPYPVDVIEQTEEFAHKAVLSVVSARSLTVTPDNSAAVDVPTVAKTQKEPARQRQSTQARPQPKAKPQPVVALAAPPPEPAAQPVAAPAVSKPARKQGQARKRAVEPAVQVKKVHREPSPQERFALFLADARYALAQGDTARAKSLVQRAMQLAPGNAAAAELLLEVQLRSGDTDAATKTLREGLQRDPHNAAYAQALARLLAAQGEDNAAIGYLRTALANGRADGQSLALLAGLERRVGDHESAAAHYVDALAQDRTVAVWWLGLGMSLESLAQPDEARAAFVEAQRIGGLDGDVAAFVEERLVRLDAAPSR